MKPSKLAFTAAATLAVLAAGALAAGSAQAHGRGGPRVSFGFNFGFPGYYGSPYGYYPSPYYYYPAPVYYSAPVVVQQAPTYYVERHDAPPAQPAPSAAAPSQNYWFYCGDSRTYYPYVKECPGGWQRVSPTPQ